MSWEQLEKIFDRAIKYSLSRKKIFVVFPLLVLCGLLLILCQALAIGAGEWVLLSLTFLPIFLSSGILLAGGSILIRMYHHDLRGTEFSLRRVLQKSWQMLLNISYLALPLLLTYLLLWMVMGLFYLLQEIPGIGEAVGVVLAFGPFLLVLGSILLSVFSLIVLFFVTPEAALKTGVKLKLIAGVYLRLKQGVFSNLIFLVIGVLPLVICLGLLYLAATVTGGSFLAESSAFSLVLQRFFIMVPFCALLAPSVVFFFNFATESFLLSQKKIALHNPPSVV